MRVELKEEIATDGSGSLLTVSLPGGCASAQVEMGQMEGCVFVRSETKKDGHTRTRAHVSWKRRQWVAML